MFMQKPRDKLGPDGLSAERRALKEFLRRGKWANLWGGRTRTYSFGDFIKNRVAQSSGFFTVLPAAHYEMPSKTARDCQFNLLAFSRADSDAPRPDAPKQRAFTLKSSLTASYAAAAGVSEGKVAWTVLVKISVSLTFEEKSLQHFPEMFTLISRHLIRHSVVPYNSKTVFVVLGGGKSLWWMIWFRLARLQVQHGCGVSRYPAVRKHLVTIGHPSSIHLSYFLCRFVFHKRRRLRFDTPGSHLFSWFQPWHDRRASAWPASIRVGYRPRPLARCVCRAEKQTLGSLCWDSVVSPPRELLQWRIFLVWQNEKNTMQVPQFVHFHIMHSETGVYVVGGGGSNA